LGYNLVKKRGFFAVDLKTPICAIGGL